MVTNLDPQRQLVSNNRAPSVSSRASTTRRHRQSRGHHGSPSSSTQNEFPFFAQTGDVEVSLTSLNGRKEQRYLLHSLILSQGSGFFELDLRDELSHAITAGPATQDIHQPRPLQPTHALVADAPLDSRSISAVARLPAANRSKKRWRYVLDWGNTDDQDVPRLVQRQPTWDESSAPPPVSLRNKPPVSSEAFFRSMSNFSALNLSTRAEPSRPDPDDEILRDYDNLLRVLYNYPPSLNAVNIADAYTECKALLHLAEMYDALDIVGTRIDYHLLQFGNRLFKQIAKYPPSYLKLGYLARSKTIFSEALIHVVGQWPLGRPQLERQTDPAVLDLIEDKVDIFEETKARVEGKLFRITLTTSRGDRVTPSNSFLDWLTMSLFRQWLAENTSPILIPPPAPKEPSRPPSHSSHDNRASRSTALTTTTSTSRSLIPTTHPQTSSRSSSHHPQPTTTSSTRRDSAHPGPPPQPQQPSPTQSGRIYRLLGSANKEAYLPQDELKRFLKHAPEGVYTRENLRRVQRRMDELKGMAREVVRPLVRNMLELDLVAAGLDGGSNGGGGGGLGYLTCTRVGEGDFVWED